MTKPTKWSVRPAKTQISLGIRPVWSESSLSAGRKLGSLATHWAHSPGWSESWLGAQVILLVLSCGSSNCLMVLRCRMKHSIKRVTVQHHVACWVYLTRLDQMHVCLACRWSCVRSLGPATFFHWDWSWNNFYGHSLPTVDSSRAAKGCELGTG